MRPACVSERPLEDHQVDRPQVYVQKCTAQLSGTNGQIRSHQPVAGHAVPVPHQDQARARDTKVVSPWYTQDEPARESQLCISCGSAMRIARRLATRSSNPDFVPEGSSIFRSFVGDHRRRETPVPIPNTAVKPSPPMILHRGKVGHRRLLSPMR